MRISSQTPQEKIVQIRKMSVKIGLNLDQNALKCLARLPFYRARDLLDGVQLGGRNRAGVNNPSKYIRIACQKMSVVSVSSRVWRWNLLSPWVWC